MMTSWRRIRSNYRSLIWWAASCLAFGVLVGCGDLEEDDRSEEEEATADDGIEDLIPYGEINIYDVCGENCPGDDGDQFNTEELQFDRPDFEGSSTGDGADDGGDGDGSGDGDSADDDDGGDDGTAGDGDGGDDGGDDGDGGTGDDDGDGGDDGAGGGEGDDGTAGGDDGDAGDGDGTSGDDDDGGEGDAGDGGDGDETQEESDDEQDESPGHGPPEHAGGDDESCYPEGQGYWENKQEDWPIEFGECTDDNPDGCLCGHSYYDDILTESTSDDGAWMILARQWLTAILNEASGADTSMVEEELMEAEELVFNCEIAEEEHGEATDLADLLDAYNNGEFTDDCD